MFDAVPAIRLYSMWSGVIHTGVIQYPGMACTLKVLLAEGKFGLGDMHSELYIPNGPRISFMVLG